MFKKILVPLDGSDLASKVLPKVVELAKTCKAQITLAHACYTPMVGEASPGVIKAAEPAEKKWCSTFLGQAAKSVQDAGVDVNTICLDGEPAGEIINYAEKNGMDLIAIATHGRGEMAWVLGSIAEKVVSHATVPVLLFRVLEFKPILKEVYFATPGVG